MIKAVLMAGGKGSRIRPLTLSRPKPMIPVANRPMIEYIVEKVKKAGYDELIVTLSYLKSQIKNLLEEDYPDMNILYSVEQKPLGTAGGVKKAAKYIDDTFFVLSGDVLVDVDLNELLRFHKENKALATLVLTPVDNPSHFGIAVLDDENQIIKFLEKPSPQEVFSKMANTGTYILEPEILDYISTKKGEVDFSQDVFPQLIKEQAGIYGYVLDGYWNDVGRPKTYLQANYDVLNKKIKTKPYGRKLPEGVGRLGDIWIGKGVKIGNKVRLIGPVVMGDNCVIEENCVLGQNTVIGDNVHLEKKSTIKGSVIFPDSTIKEDSYLKDCIVDSDCVIERGSYIEKGAILGSHVHLGSHSRVRSKRSIYNSTVILPESIVDSDYPIVT
ncbi:sugar phosphate nucleotidyltransferase [Methanobacterium petrolearium]|uniref:sugar phosphate nucleotidyltransferase n=1 Tax=Methanobacterium petrolearium TaxID=710190 RepID=UPI001AE2A4E6|nr:NDP-sugar synthase [Methanobacterium petrolearium]MBP1945107.1 glucose-1-phosphate thymidylyltransferase long form [Methanobacterium petrolearium]BDZ71029.1 mannose-1-phosphate guanylyltransferase [Methanobacterium petrolearium]